MIVLVMYKYCSDFALWFGLRNGFSYLCFGFGPNAVIGFRALGIHFGFLHLLGGQ